jgi:MoxR-like ATPase
MSELRALPTRAPERVGIGEISDVASSLRKGLGLVVIEEKDAIEDLVDSLVSGVDIAEGGPPGSGKTLAMNTLAQLVGADESQIAKVQGLSDTSPTQLVGGKAQKPIETSNGIEIVPIPIPGAFGPATVLGKIDEWPRLNPRAREALYPVLEERRVRHTDEYDLPNLLLVMATMNKPDRRAAIRSAEARRFPAGTMFDVEDEQKQRDKSIMVADAGDLHQMKIEPVTSPQQIRAIQNTVAGNRDAKGNKIVTFPFDLKDQAYEYQKLIKETVEHFRPDSESTTSMSAQMARIAVGRAMAREQDRVQPEQVLKAAQRIITSRIIQLADGESNIQTLVAQKRQELANL